MAAIVACFKVCYSVICLGGLRNPMKSLNLGSLPLGRCLNPQHSVSASSRYEYLLLKDGKRLFSWYYF
jgi:hypothetical protein